MKHVRIGKDEYINPDLYMVIKGWITPGGMQKVVLEAPDHVTELTGDRAKHLLERMAMTADAIEDLRDTIRALNAEVAELSRQMAVLGVGLDDFDCTDEEDIDDARAPR